MMMSRAASSENYIAADKKKCTAHKSSLGNICHGKRSIDLASCAGSCVVMILAGIRDRQLKRKEAQPLHDSLSNTKVNVGERKGFGAIYFFSLTIYFACRHAQASGPANQKASCRPREILQRDGHP